MRCSPEIFPTCSGKTERETVNFHNICSWFPVESLVYLPVARIPITCQLCCNTLEYFLLWHHTSSWSSPVVKCTCEQQVQNKNPDQVLCTSFKNFPVCMSEKGALSNHHQSWWWHFHKLEAHDIQRGKKDRRTWSHHWTFDFSGSAVPVCDSSHYFLRSWEVNYVWKLLIWIFWVPHSRIT